MARRVRAWVAKITKLLNLDSWPMGMRVIARKERPHPGAQLRVTDADGPRVTAFATNTTPGGPVANSPTWNYATSPRPGRGPHPVRKGHRADLPAPARPGPEPHPVPPGDSRL